MAVEKRRSDDDVTVQQVGRARWQMWALAIGGPLLVIAVGLSLFAAGVPLPSSSGEPPAWRTGPDVADVALPP